MDISHVGVELRMPCSIEDRRVAYKCLMDFDIWDVTGDVAVVCCLENELPLLKERFEVVSAQPILDLISPDILRLATPGYHTVLTLGEDMSRLARDSGGTATVETIGMSCEGRAIEALRITKRQGAGLPRVLIVGCHHAREWLSVEIPFLIADRLVGKAGDSAIDALLRSIEFWIVPMLNPDGHFYTEQLVGPDGTIPAFWRKNRRRNADGSLGVDLNRNYDIDWDGAGSSPNTISPMYRGTAAFSEPETAALALLARRCLFAAAVSYHAYSQEILHPFGFANPPCDAACQGQLDEVVRVADGMATAATGVFGERYVSMPTSQHYGPGSAVSGDCCDWLFSSFRTRAVTVELRPRVPDCLHAGPGCTPWRIPVDKIPDVFEENWRAAMVLMEHVAACDGPA